MIENQKIEKLIALLTRGFPETSVGLAIDRPNGISYFGAIKEYQRFPTYSLTKTIIALLTLMKCQDEKIDLNEKICSVLNRSLPEWMNDVAINHLLSHRSGISDYGVDQRYHDAVRQSPGKTTDKDKILNIVLDRGPLFNPGESFFYSNVGYVLLTEFLTSKFGISLQDQFQTIIGDKLRISSLLLDGTTNNIVSGFSNYFSNEKKDVRGYYDFSWVLHGTFESSLYDLVKIFSSFDLLLEPKFLKPMIQLIPVNMSHKYINPSYGLGLMGDLHYNKGPIYGHSGEGPGFSVASYHLQSKNLTLASVVNQDSVLSAETLIYETLNLIQI